MPTNFNAIEATVKYTTNPDKHQHASARGQKSFALHVPRKATVDAVRDQVRKIATRKIASDKHLEPWMINISEIIIT